ncbi:hypothetical protein KAR91_38370 [Candidatus Pacearchaeota archaeon]|nr:hypothetical protein [Candidatus Pacearchaeota archaeon]
MDVEQVMEVLRKQGQSKRVVAVSCNADSSLDGGNVLAVVPSDKFEIVYILCE